MANIKLKICGVQNDKEAIKLAKAGVDMIGLNFVHSSSLCISLEMAKRIQSVVNTTDVKTVLLFQNQPLQDVKQYIKILKPDFVQLHGNESRQYIKSLEVPVIKAIPVSEVATVEAIQKYIDTRPAEYYLLDREVQGSGKLVDMHLAKDLTEAHPYRIFLAGGITPQNIGDITKVVEPHGVDIASGVRTNDNLDIAKVYDCVKALKA